jgi:hypothetical protein
MSEVRCDEMQSAVDVSNGRLEHFYRGELVRF